MLKLFVYRIVLLFSLFLAGQKVQECDATDVQLIYESWVQ